LNALYGERYQAYSAGTGPSGVSPYAVKARSEIGIDISKNRSKHIKELQGPSFDCIVTVCGSAGESCPFFPVTGTHIHKSFYNPALFRGGEDETPLVFMKVRDEIGEWITSLFGRG